jgi:hypothetical protein
MDLGLLDQEQHDHWFDLEPPADYKGGQKWTGRVRFGLHYMYSRTKLLTGFVNKWSLQIESEDQEYRDLKRVLKHMESPFGFIEGFQMANEADRDASSRRADFDERAESNDWFQNIPPGLWEKVEGLDPIEKNMEATVDVISVNIAQKFGYAEVPWFRFTWVLLMIYILLTVLVMFYKADFLN